MKEYISYVNDRDFEKAYASIAYENQSKIQLSAFDFLFECVAENAFDFLQFCIKRNPDRVIRLALCNLITYGDVAIANQHSLIYGIVKAILIEDPNYLPALEFVIYNYFEHPESPFTDSEIVAFANTVLQFYRDELAIRIVKHSKTSK